MGTLEMIVTEFGQVLCFALRGFNSSMRTSLVKSHLPTGEFSESQLGAKLPSGPHAKIWQQNNAGTPPQFVPLGFSGIIPPHAKMESLVFSHLQDLVNNNF